MQATFALFSRSVTDYIRSLLTPAALVGMPVILLLVLLPIADSARFGAAAGAQWMSVIGVVNLIALSLIAYGYFLASIAEERDASALDLLRMSRLSALSIVFGKWGARLISVLLLVVVQLPLVMLAVTLGGVRTLSVFGFYAGMIGWCVMLSGVALMISVTSRSVTEAATRGFAVALIFAGAIAFGSVWISSLGIQGQLTGSPAGTDWEWAKTLVLGVIAVLSSLIPSTNSTATSLTELAGELALPTLLQFGIGLGCAARAAWLLPRIEFSDRSHRLNTAAAKGGAGAARRIVGRCPEQQPAFWKALQFETGGNVAFGVRWGVVIFLTVARFCDLDLGGDGLRNTFSWTPLGFLGLACIWFFDVVLYFSRTWSVEWKQQTLGALAMTPLSIQRLALQKYKAWIFSRLPYIFLFLTLWLALWIELEARQNRFGRPPELSLFAFVILHVCSETIALAGFLVYFTSRMRSGGTITALVLLGAFNVFLTVVTVQVASAVSLSGISELISFLYSMATALAGIFAFRATLPVLRERAAED
jgi:hypothetical protein